MAIKPREPAPPPAARTRRGTLSGAAALPVVETPPAPSARARGRRAPAASPAANGPGIDSAVVDAGRIAVELARLLEDLLERYPKYGFLFNATTISPRARKRTRVGPVRRAGWYGEATELAQELSALCLRLDSQFPRCRITIVVTPPGKNSGGIPPKGGPPTNPDGTKAPKR